MFNNLPDMVWIELRKAIRSRMPLWTTLACLFMPVGGGFLILLAKNPELSRQMGLISAKANLTAYYGTNWASYLVLFAQIIAAGGFFFYVLATSWVFGREFVDGVVKDLLAVPVRRSSILLAKFIVVGLWSAAQTALILVVGLGIGALLRLPGGSTDVIFKGVGMSVISAGLTIAVTLPFAYFASLGRGYLLPVGVAIIMAIAGNLVVVMGWGEFFPWAVPMLYAQGKSYTGPASYWVAVLTGLAGMLITYLWWKTADQNR